MSRQTSIQAQLRRATEILPKIESEYQSSLEHKNIQEDLKLDIQSYCGHLRSALDYLANDIVEKYCPSSRGNLYFPISASEESFKKTMRISYPELETNCPELFNLLESIQPYKSPENNWLLQFNEVNIGNKHHDLVEQTHTEWKETKVSRPDGSSASWNQGAVTFGSGPGVSISILGAEIDPRTQLPVSNESVKVELITWVNFIFKDINVSVLWLLKETLKRIQEINEEVLKYL